jgi:hypothetical protein
LLLNRSATDQRSARRSASVASYAVCRGGWTVHDGNKTHDRSDNKLQTGK